MSALILGCSAAAAQTAGGASPADTTELEPINVEGQASGARQDGAPPPTGTIGLPPKAYAGGQVATGGRVGFLGSRSVFDTPFTQNSYTEELVRNQQSVSILGVLDNNPAVRAVASPFSPQPNVFIRGFEVNSREFAFDGLYGIASPFRHSPEGAERIEVLNGPAAFLFGFPPDGNVGGVVNIIPKRAGDEPLTRITTQYFSDSTFGGSFDVGRRFGDGDAWGVRVNGSYREGHTPIDRNKEEFGNITLGLDYRGDRFRFSADFGYQDFDGRGLIQSFFVAPAVTDIPKAPSLKRSMQQPWDRFDSSHAYSTARAEFDVTDSVTAFAAIGGSKTKSDLLSARPRLMDDAGTVNMTPTAISKTHRSGPARRA